jgi:arsenite/tail-anchored protein-transporting ATPase
VTAKRGKSPRRVAKTSRPSSTKTSPAVFPFRYIFFGGKGGVGKTTAAAATALFFLNRAKSKESILLFSTDPAHSLSDSLDTEVGNRPVTVSTSRGAKLVAYEMDATAALERFRSKHGPILAEIAERGTLLDESDINELLNLSLPGLDEVMSLFELSELDTKANYDRIIVDTAPSGHTTRLLRLPEVFARMVSALDRMAEKHRYIVAHFARRRAPLDEVDLFLRELSERIARVRNLLENSEQSSFSLVAIPEALSVRETQRYLQVLREQDVPVTDLIVNRVEQEHAKCGYCRARVQMQRPWLKELATTFKGLRIHYLPLLPQEVRGTAALRAFGELIWFGSSVSESPKLAVQSPVVLKTKPAIIERDQTFSIEERKMVIFGGKGGVGKTTAAAAFALSLAKNNARRRVLVFSTDPAHSLSDSFAENVGQLKKGVAKIKNLDAMEIDPGKWFDDLKQRYRAWTDSLFSSLTGGSKLEIKFDREAMRELVELTPPGIDEIAALSSITDLLEQKDYDTIVLDTAPTGHLIRFLELPQVALSWVRTFIKLLLKYQHIVHASKIAEELVSLSKGIKRVLALLTDAGSCEFVGVAIAERMSLEETSDLVRSLNVLRVPMRQLLVNGIVPEKAAAGCEFCNDRRSAQIEVLDEFRSRFGSSIALSLAPQQTSEIRGPESLLRHFKAWRYFESASAKQSGTRLQTSRSADKNVRRVKSKR